MKPIASQPKTARSPRLDGEAGFTLTEMVAGLLVASMLIVGLADITRRYALTTMRVRDAGSEVRTAQIVGGLFSELKRIDPDSLELSSNRIEATLGSRPITARLEPPSNGARLLQWSSPAINRTVRLPQTARFELTPLGAILLVADPAEPPLAIVTPVRTAPFDCQFDTVTRACR